MYKRPKRQSFAEIVRDVETLPSAPPPKRDHAGLYAGDVMVDQQGRVYALVAERLSASRALELASAGAVVVWNPCGCGGGCGMDWFDPQDVAAMVSSGAADIRNTKRARGTISEWRTEDDACLLLAEDAVRWGDRLR